MEEEIPLNRWLVITRNDDDEMWNLTEQVIEREFLEDGRIRWVIDTMSSYEEIDEIVPSVEFIEAVERPTPEEPGAPESVD